MQLKRCSLLVDRGLAKVKWFNLDCQLQLACNCILYIRVYSYGDAEAIGLCYGVIVRKEGVSYWVVDSGSFVIEHYVQVVAEVNETEQRHKDA